MTKTQHKSTANSSVERDLWPVSKGHVIVRFFSKAFGSHNFPCWSLLLGTNVPNDIHYDNITNLSYLICIIVISVTVIFLENK